MARRVARLLLGVIGLGLLAVGVAKVSLATGCAGSFRPSRILALGTSNIMASGWHWIAGRDC